MELLLLIRWWCLLPLWDSVIVLCFVVRYFVSILVLQSSWWGRKSWLLCLVCLHGLWLLCGSSSRCHGFICSLWLFFSWSYSLFSYRNYTNMNNFLKTYSSCSPFTFETNSPYCECWALLRRKDLFICINSIIELRHEISTMWYVQPAKPQISLRAVWFYTCQNATLLEITCRGSIICLLLPYWQIYLLFCGI